MEQSQDDPYKPQMPNEGASVAEFFAARKVSVAEYLEEEHHKWANRDKSGIDQGQITSGSAARLSLPQRIMMLQEVLIRMINPEATMALSQLGIVSNTLHFVATQNRATMESINRDVALDVTYTCAPLLLGIATFINSAAR